ncbi:Autophagy-related protein 8C-like [Ranunculus cassubicifolius]
MAAKSSFKLEYALERMQQEASIIREKYPDRIPKVERTDIPDINKKKLVKYLNYLWLYIWCQRLLQFDNLSMLFERGYQPKKAIFIFVKNIQPPTAAMRSAIYEENKDEDGFLYMTYIGENTFGKVHVWVPCYLFNDRADIQCPRRGHSMSAFLQRL